MVYHMPILALATMALIRGIDTWSSVSLLGNLDHFLCPVLLVKDLGRSRCAILCLEVWYFISECFLIFLIVVSMKTSWQMFNCLGSLGVSDIVCK